MGDTLFVHQANEKRMVMIDDLRFRNEYEYLRGKGAMIIRVDRPNLEIAGGHASEMDWPDLDDDAVCDSLVDSLSHAFLAPGR